MNRRIFTVCFLCVCSLLVITPLTGSPVLSYGVHGGIASTNMLAIDSDGDRGRSPSPIVGALAGGYAEYPVWSHESEAIRLLARSGVQYALLGADAGGKLGMHYLQVPLLARLAFDLEVSGSSYLIAGLAGGYLVGASAEVPVDLDTYNRAELTAVAGVGYSTPWGVSLDLRYQRGLTRREAEDSGFPVSLYNSTISLVAGYSIQ